MDQPLPEPLADQPGLSRNPLPEPLAEQLGLDLSKQDEKPKYEQNSPSKKPCSVNFVHFQAGKMIKPGKYFSNDALFIKNPSLSTIYDYFPEAKEIRVTYPEEIKLSQKAKLVTWCRDIWGGDPPPGHGNGMLLYDPENPQIKSKSELNDIIVKVSMPNCCYCDRYSPNNQGNSHHESICGARYRERQLRNQIAQVEKTSQTKLQILQAQNSYEKEQNKEYMTCKFTDYYQAYWDIITSNEDVKQFVRDNCARLSNDVLLSEIIKTMGSEKDSFCQKIKISYFFKIDPYQEYNNELSKTVIKSIIQEFEKSIYQEFEEARCHNIKNYFVL